MNRLWVVAFLALAALGLPLGAMLAPGSEVPSDSVTGPFYTADSVV